LTLPSFHHNQSAEMIKIIDDRLQPWEEQKVASNRYECCKSPRSMQVSIAS
jgi:hypothetical protein